VPEVQTEETVRAFSGTLRRISGGGGVAVSSFDPLTSDTAVDDILVEDRNAPALIFCFDTADWLDILVFAPHENPNTPLIFCSPDKRRQVTMATLFAENLIFAMNSIAIDNCDGLIVPRSVHVEASKIRIYCSMTAAK